jgi:hypothetical protein
MFYFECPPTYQIPSLAYFGGRADLKHIVLSIDCSSSLAKLYCFGSILLSLEGLLASTA